MFQRVHPILGSVIVPERAKKENPVGGIITIPSSGGDGFIRVSDDGVVVSYVNPVKGPSYVPLALSSGETSTTSSTETTFRSFTLKAGEMKTSDHLHYECGGFVTASGGNISSVRFRGKIGGSAFLDQGTITQTINDGQAATWHCFGVLTRDATGDGDVGVGGVFHWDGPTDFTYINRGEITSFSSATWAAPLTIEFTGEVTISAGTGFIVSETFEIFKASLG